MMLLLAIILLCAAQPVLLQVTSIRVKNGTELVAELCSLNRSTTLVLDPSILYEIHSNVSCVGDGSLSLFIMSSIKGQLVNVTCCFPSQMTLTPLAGFGMAFIDFQNVSIQDVIFNGCGAYLETFSNDLLNNSIKPIKGKYFSSNYSGFLVFINSTISLNRVVFTDYNGFAIIAINPSCAYFNNVTVLLSRSCKYFSYFIESLGSGVVVVFTNTPSNTPFDDQVSAIVTFNKCNFSENCDLYSQQCSPTAVDQHGVLQYGTALTLHSYNVSQKLLFIISNSTFLKNYGTKSGLLVHLIDTYNTKVIINKKSTFKNTGSSECAGSSIEFYMYANHKWVNRYSNKTIASITPLTVTDTVFDHNRGLVGAYANYDRFRPGTVYIGIERVNDRDVILSFSNISFMRNMADKYSSCLLVEVYRFMHNSVNVLLSNITANHNLQTSYNGNIETGLFYFVNVHMVELSGTNLFRDNVGSVIRCDNSELYLSGFVSFENNYAQSGAALNVMNALIHFKKGLNLLLRNNSARYLGGAIYVHTSNYHDFPLCALQLPLHTQFNISAYENTAQFGGDLVHAYPAYSCYMSSHSKEQKITTQFYAERLNFTQHCNESGVTGVGKNLPFSTKVDHMNFHANNALSSKPHYAGETITIYLNASDVMNNLVYSKVHIQLVKLESFSDSIKVDTIMDSKRLAPGQNLQIIQENRLFSPVNVTVSLDNENSYHEIFVVISSVGSSECQSLKQDLNIIECPFGFSLINGICQCGDVVQSFYQQSGHNAEKCDINDRTIPIPNGIINHQWVGICNNTFCLSHVCPLRFCTSTFNHIAFQYDGTRGNDNFYLIVKLNHTRSLICHQNRQGVICGECTDGTSVVFGTSECKQCSNWWLWSIILYMIAGPTLICVMYMLRLTLKAGTLNAIIFFAQIAEVGLMEGMMYFREHVPLYSLRFVFIFISLLNLNLGFPLCFFNGMNEFWKTGLSLVFPIYLLSINLIMICVGHMYTNRFSNRFIYSSVQILVTVVHLSLSKLLIITIDVFTPAIIYIEDNPSAYVWYSNGNEPFNIHNTRLIILMVLTTIVTGVFLVPYFTAVIFGKCLIKSSFRVTYFRLAYEAMHAPYREKKKYWFGARFLLQLSLYMVFAVFRYFGFSVIYFVSLPLVIAFLMIQVYLRPFKTKGLNLLDSSTMLILVGMYIISWYVTLNYAVKDHHDIKISMTVLVILVVIVFVLFLSVIVYHVALVTTLYDRITTVLRITRKKFRGGISPYHEEENQPFLTSEDTHDSSFYRSNRPCKVGLPTSENL